MDFEQLLSCVEGIEISSNHLPSDTTKNNKEDDSVLPSSSLNDGDSNTNNDSNSNTIKPSGTRLEGGGEGYFDMMSELDIYHRIMKQVHEDYAKSDIYEKSIEEIYINLTLIIEIAQRRRLANDNTNRSHNQQQDEDIKKDLSYMDQYTTKIIHRLQLLKDFNQIKDKHMTEMTNFISSEMVKWTNLLYKKGVIVIRITDNECDYVDMSVTELRQLLVKMEKNYTYKSMESGGGGGNSGGGGGGGGQEHTPFIHIPKNMTGIRMESYNDTILPLNNNNINNVNIGNNSNNTGRLSNNTNNNNTNNSNRETRLDLSW